MTLSSLKLLKITGDDAEHFLQGQLTQDVSNLGEQWTYAGYCNPKGRLQALFILWHQGDDFYALLDASLIEPVIKRLKMYVMRSKVIIDEVPDAEVCGLDSISALESEFKISPPSISATTSKRQTQWTVFDNEQTALHFYQRVLLIRPRPSESKIAPSLQQVEQAWQQSNILAGIPQISALTAELFIPQMINLDYLGGISFKKGCYTGQEIVARMHYLGKLKQRMFVLEHDAALHSRTKAGDKIYLDQQAIKGAGQVVAAVDGFNALLGVIRLQYQDQILYLKDGTTVRISTKQPYAHEL